MPENQSVQSFIPTPVGLISQGENLVKEDFSQLPPPKNSVQEPIGTRKERKRYAGEHNRSCNGANNSFDYLILGHKPAFSTGTMKERIGKSFSDSLL